MGTLNIVEFPARTEDVHGAADVGDGSRAVCQNVTTSGAAATPTNPFGPYAAYVTLCADVAVFVKFGASPTASAAGGSIYLPANVPMSYGVTPGHTVSVIDA